MLSYQEEDLEVDSCPECFGIWFDGEELRNFFPKEKLVSRLMSPAPGGATPGAGKRTCPRCQVELTESSVGDVEVDVCRKCRGIWLDEGELSRVVEQYKAGRRGNLVVLNQVAEGLRAWREPKT